MTPRFPKCNGFTLIELLVVVAIIGSLLGLFSISSRPSRKTQMRMAAQSLASLLLTTQTHALNSDVGAAIWLSRAGIFSADVPTQESLVQTVNEIMDIDTGATIVPVDLLARDSVRVQLSEDPPLQVYRARFISPTGSSPVLPPSPWFVVSAVSVDNNTADVSFYGSQAVTNTVWPSTFYLDPEAPLYSIEFHQYPGRSSLTEAWPKLASIDLRYSGFGEEIGGFSADSEACLLFNKAGQPEVLFSGSGGSVTAHTIRESLYLLIAYADDITNGRDTLANDDSIWLRMEGETGHVTMAWNNAVTDPSLPPAEKLEHARQYLREGKGLSR